MYDAEEIFEADFDSEEDETGLAVVAEHTEVAADYVEPGFYRCLCRVTRERGTPMEIGDVFYVGERQALDDRTITVYWGDDELWLKADVFKTNYEGPLGEEALIARQEEVMAEMRAIEQAAQHSAGRLTTYNPHMLPTGEVAGTAIVKAESVSVDEAKKELKTRANEVQKVAVRMQGKAAQLQALVKTKAAVVKAQLNSQMALFQAQVAGMQAMIKKAEEALWTINLYLGTEEQIYKLADGPAAPASAPIKVQQMVLYMDEECAVEDAGGSMSGGEVWKFNEWLLADPAHVQQICPFEKAIVALKPRRNAKQNHGSGSVMQAFADAENAAKEKKTYFLFKNGETLYWMTTKFDAQDVLVPKMEDFLPHFAGLQTVGDEQYMNVLRQSTKLSAHWMRVGLIIQGIIDRTTIFAPMEHKPNILMAGDYGVGVEFVRDAELMLGTGLESFNDWRLRVNSKLEVGCRVVGAFSNYDYGLRQYAESRGYRNDRLSPSSAYGPDDDKIYEIDSKREGYFVFKYVRSGEYRDYERRASCKIKPTDKFILNIDGVETVEEMERFLNDRSNRHLYEYMFPVLKAAIALKREEEAAEAPFKRLLVSQLSASAEDVDELVKVYKFKNKYHRALTADDAEAFKAITEEYPRLQKRRRDSDRLSGLSEDFVRQVLDETVLLIGHVQGSEYRVIRAANKEKVWAHEDTWTVGASGCVLKGTREWTVVDNRSVRWNVLYRNEEALDGWKINANPNEFLTDPEVLEVFDLATAKFKQETGRILCHRKTYTQGLQLSYWKEAVTSPSTPITGKWAQPRVDHYTIEWSKKGGRVQVNYLGHHSYCTAEAMTPWAISEEDTYGYATKELLWVSEDEVAAYEQAGKDFNRLYEPVADMKRLANEYSGNVMEDAKTQLRDRVYADFIAEHGDPELWDGYVKQHPEKFEMKYACRTWNGKTDLGAAIDEFVEGGVNIEGMTVRELIGAYAGQEEDEVIWVPHKHGGSSGTHTGRRVRVKKNDTPEDMMEIRLRRDGGR